MKRSAVFLAGLAGALLAGQSPYAVRSAAGWQVPDVGPAGPVLTLPVTANMPLNVQVRNVTVNLINQAGSAYDANAARDAAQTALTAAQRDLSKARSEPPPPGSGETARRVYQDRLAEAQRQVEQRQQELSAAVRTATQLQNQFKQTQLQYQTLQKNPDLPQVDSAEIWAKLNEDKVPEARPTAPPNFRELVDKFINWDGTSPLPTAALRPGPGQPGDPLPLTQRHAAWRELEAQHDRCLELHGRMSAKLDAAEDRRRDMERSQQEMTAAQSALRDAEAAFDDLRPSPIDYSLFDRCPEGNPWSECDHEEIKQQWLREQNAGYEREKLRLREAYDDALADYEDARSQLQSDIDEYVAARSDVETISTELQEALAKFKVLAQKYENR